MLHLHHDSQAECQVQIRTLISILRVRGTVLRVEVSLLHDDVDRVDVRLLFEHGVRKLHRLTYEDRPSLFPTVDADPPYALEVSPLTAREWMDHMASTGKSGECTLWCTPNGCVLKSRCDEPSDTKAIKRSIQTEIRVQLSDLDLYHVPDETDLVFPLWELRACIGIAEQLGVPLKLAFGGGGDPLFVYMDHAPVHAEFIIATTGEGTARASTRRASPPARAASTAMLAPSDAASNATPAQEVASAPSTRRARQHTAPQKVDGNSHAYSVVPSEEYRAHGAFSGGAADAPRSPRVGGSTPALALEDPADQAYPAVGDGPGADDAHDAPPPTRDLHDALRPTQRVVNPTPVQYGGSYDEFPSEFMPGDDDSPPRVDFGTPDLSPPADTFAATQMDGPRKKVCACSADLC